MGQTKILGPVLLTTCCYLILTNSRADAQGVVAAGTPQATQAGVDILNAGGNGVDAAVAVAFTLAVTEPAGSGIFGQTYIMVHPPKQAPFVITGTSFAPRKIPPKARFKDLQERRATTVPSTVKVLDYAWRKHGSGKISWKRLLEPAIRAAEDGYILGHFRQRSLVRYARNLIEDAATAKIYLGANPVIPPIGARVKNQALAGALRRLAEFGADDFYKGRIARDIADDMKKNKGWITLEDLEKFPEPKTVAPLKDSYRGYDAYSLPPPTGGWVVLLSLNILERAPKSSLTTENDERRTVWMAETLRVTHALREQAPITNFTQYASQVAKKIGDANVTSLLKTMQLPEDRPGGGETTHFSLVDNDGTAVAVTASLNAYFGAQRAHPKWGFLYNDYMHEFVTKPDDHPYRLRPGAMPYSSMSGTILAKNGQPVLAVGSPGSKRIISAVVQVASHWVDVGQGIQAAVTAPRIHVIPEDDLHVEFPRQQMTTSLLLQLELRGYSVVRPLSSLFKKDLNPFFGGVHAVARDGGSWQGAADPRRDGTVGFSTVGKKERK